MASVHADDVSAGMRESWQTLSTHPKGFPDGSPTGRSPTFLERINALVRNTTGRVLRCLFTVVLYYADFGSDIALAVEFLNPPQEGINREASITAGYVTLGLLGLLPVANSVVDLATEKGMGLFGVLLNFCNGRMLWFVYKGGTRVEASAAAADGKLAEAMLESAPQVYLQMAVLAAGLVSNDAQDLAYASIAISVASIVTATTSKFFSMYGWDMLADGGSVLKATAAWVYFAADMLSRAFAIHLIVSRHGLSMGSIAPYYGVLIGAEVVGRWLLFLAAAIYMPFNRKHGEVYKKLFRVVQIKHKRCRWWCPDPSVISAVMSLFSSMPLSINPTERRWLFVTSTAMVLSMALNNRADGESEPSATIVVVYASLAAKAVVLAVAEALGTRVFADEVQQEFDESSEAFSGYAANDSFGFRAFTWTVDSKAQEASRDKNSWVNWFEQETLPKSKVQDGEELLHLDWSYHYTQTGGPVSFDPAKARLEGLVAWLDGLDKLDEVKDDTARARRMKQRRAINKINCSRCKVGPRGAELLANAVKRLPAMQSLDLFENNLGAVGGKTVAGVLAANTGMETVNLISNQLGEIGGKAVIDALAWNKTVTTIRLNGNDLGEVSGKAVADALAVNKTVMTMHLKYNDGLPAAVKDAIRTAWGDRGGNLEL